MECKIMVLPSSQSAKIRVLKIPDDMERQEAYRYATGLIAAAEESTPDYGWDEIEDSLEAQGFSAVDYVLGPTLD